MGEDLSFLHQCFLPGLHYGVGCHQLCILIVGSLLIWHQICGCNHCVRIEIPVELFWIEMCQLGWWTLPVDDQTHKEKGCGNYSKHLWLFSWRWMVCGEQYERGSQHYGSLSYSNYWRAIGRPFCMVIHRAFSESPCKNTGLLVHQMVLVL